MSRVPMTGSLVGNIGRRIELVSMDSHFHDITLGLYDESEAADPASFLVHTYSRREGAESRVNQVAAAMAVLGGMSVDPRRLNVVRFHCGSHHEFACRRIFLEAVKLDPDAGVEAKPLSIFDKKSEQIIEIHPQGSGEYVVRSEEDNDKASRRAAVAALGLVRLGQMHLADDTSDQIRFDCGTSHDPLVGLLLSRALNVRAAMREVEAQASRGVLAAPSAQAE